MRVCASYVPTLLLWVTALLVVAISSVFLRCLCYCFRSCATSSQGDSIVGYHATNATAAQKIRANGFQCGRKGLAGGAIYFATSEQHASRKSNHGNDVVLKCQVTLGRTLTLDEDGDPTMTLDKLNGKGYDSVKILRNGDEYAVYEPSRVRVLSVC